MKRKNVLSSILLNIIVLNTATYSVYATNAQLRDNKQVSSNSNELTAFNKTNCEINPNLVPNDKIIKNTNDEQNLSDNVQKCNKTKLKCNRRGSLDPSQAQLLKSALSNNSETISSNEKYKRNGVRTSSVVYKQVLPNTNMIRYNNVLHYNTLRKLSITYPEISNEILINLFYNIKLKSIQHSLNNRLNGKDNISLDDIVFLLLNNSSAKYDTAPDDASNNNDEEENDILNNSVELLQNVKLKLVDYENTYTLNQKIEDNIISYVIKSIKDKKSNKINNILFQKFITKLKKQFRKNLNYALYLKTQHENIYDLESMMYTYFTLNSSLLSENKININYDNLQYELSTLNKTILQNINCVYRDCLFGNSLPVSKDLSEINNTIRAINTITDNESIINTLNTINKKVSDLEHNNANEWYMKYLSSDLKMIKKKVSEIQNNMDFSNIKKALHPITLKLSEMSNYKLIVPINDKILNWCEEKYEDWGEVLLQYEYLVKDKFKSELNNGKLNKETLYNIVNTFYNIAMVNSQLENYHNTVKLLHNISNKSANKSQQRIFVY